MTSTAEAGVGKIRVRGSVAFDGSSLIWLALGVAVSLLAVGQRWDIPLAAWIAPVFLLRFSRTSGPGVAIAGLIAACGLQIAWTIIATGTALGGLTIAISAVLGAIYAIPYILDRTVVGRLNAAGRIALLPAAAVLIEFGIASLLPTGASIGTRANTQTENLALIQVVSLLGPYVIGFLIALGATIANHVWENPSRKTLVAYGGGFVALLLIVVGFGQARLASVASAPLGETVKVAGITPRMALRGAAAAGVSMANFPASAQTQAALATPKNKALYTRVQDELLADTLKAAGAGAQIIVWSETAAPILEADKGPFFQKVAAVAREAGAYVNVAVGVPYERNETYLLGPEGRQLWHYRKNMPVPGMEPVKPFKNDPPVVETPFGRLTNVICYDGDFPSLSRVSADIMLVPAWDWPEAAYVHTLKVARLRSVENGYSMIRVDYNGVSAAFDPYGRVLAMQDTLAGQNHAMIVDLPIRGVTTPYNRIGDLFAWLCIAATLALFLLALAGPVARLDDTELSAK